MKQINKAKRPLVLTVKGKDSAMARQTGSSQRMLDDAARADANDGIRQGLEDAKQGKLQSARKFFRDFEAEYGIAG
jgi:hypothetical protein